MMLSKSCAKILNNLENDVEASEHLRLGQYFCNKYIKGNWPELFYCEDRQKCLIMIEKWLKDNCYQNDMPQELLRASKVIQCGTEVYCK